MIGRRGILHDRHASRRLDRRQSLGAVSAGAAEDATGGATVTGGDGIEKGVHGRTAIVHFGRRRERDAILHGEKVQVGHGEVHGTAHKRLSGLGRLDAQHRTRAEDTRDQAVVPRLEMEHDEDGRRKVRRQRGEDDLQRADTTGRRPDGDGATRQRHVRNRRVRYGMHVDQRIFHHRRARDT